MKYILNPLRWKLPFQLILIITAILLFGYAIPLQIKSLCYAISLTVKEVLIFFLPVIIFSYLSSCILSFKKGVLAFIVLLLSTVYISNFLSTQMAYFVGIPFLDLITIGTATEATGGLVLAPTWSFALPEWIKNEVALFSGLGIGVIFSFFRVQKVEQFCNLLRDASTFFLNKIFMPVVPLFITGLMIKLEHDGMLTTLINNYSSVFVISLSLVFAYIILLFFIGANFNPARGWKYVRNSIPPAISGFSTMSSAATMPLTLEAAEKNSNNPNIPRAVIPGTANIHMISNCFIIPILAFTMMKVFEMPIPAYSVILMMGLNMAIAQFSVAGVPAGGIMVHIPVLTTYLGLTGEMVELLIAIYVLFDCAVASGNVFGNNAYTILFEKLLKKLKVGE